MNLLKPKQYDDAASAMKDIRVNSPGIGDIAGADEPHHVPDSVYADSIAEGRKASFETNYNNSQVSLPEATEPDSLEEFYKSGDPDTARQRAEFFGEDYDKN